MAIFTIYSSLFALSIISKKPCLCGGIMEQISWENQFYINMIFTAISIAGLKLEKKTRILTNSDQPSLA
jgi:putative oxidoreductase